MSNIAESVTAIALKNNFTPILLLPFFKEITSEKLFPKNGFLFLLKSAVNGAILNIRQQIIHLSGGGIMTVDPENRNKLKIYLTDGEIKRIFGGYGNINYTDPRSRKALGLLLKEAIRNGGFMPRGEKLLIEVHPCKRGCIITFSGLDCDKTSHMLQSEYVYTLKFEDINALLDGMHEMYLKAPPLPLSRLYRLQNTYYLTVNTVQNIKPLLIHMSEYCTDITAEKSTAAYCAEYGKLLCPANAVEKIAKGI